MAEFQSDLKNGMTLTDALTKHGLTLEKAFNILHYIPKKKQIIPNKKKHKRKPKTYTPTHYIQCRNGRYYLRKHAHGKGRAFGTYSTLEDAIRMREALKLDGWHQTHVDRLCDELGIIRCRTRGKKVRYH